MQQKSAKKGGGSHGRAGAGGAPYDPGSAARPRVSLTFDLARFQRVNAQRALRWHGGDLEQWSLLEWAGAMAGEVGEACNFAKKLRRLDKKLPNREAGTPASDADALRDKLAREVCDGIIYGLIILSALDIDAAAAIADVFDTKSVEYGFPERADMDAWS